MAIRRPMIPSITIIIKKNPGNYVCQAIAKECEVGIGFKVRWYGRKTDACVLFENKKTAWPFTEPYKSHIYVPKNGLSDEFTARTVSKKTEFEYEKRCVSCAGLKPSGPGGAVVIVDP